MPEAIIRVNDPGNWQQSFEATAEAAPAPGGRYYPIVDFTVPVLFESPILAFGASTTEARPLRKLAYWARQIVSGQGAIRGDIQFDSRRIYLDSVQMHRFELFAANYQIKIAVPFYLRDLTLSIWEYKGAIDEDFDLIRQDLLRIESKIDAL